MPKILILEDNAGRIAYFRRLYPKASIIETAQETIDALRGFDWDYLSLDHDLGGENFVDSSRLDCGMEVVRWLVEHHQKGINITVHTANKRAADLMSSALESAGYTVTKYPFGGEYDPRG